MINTNSTSQLLLLTFHCYYSINALDDVSPRVDRVGRAISCRGQSRRRTPMELWWRRTYWKPKLMSPQPEEGCRSRQEVAHVSAAITLLTRVSTNPCYPTTPVASLTAVYVTRPALLPDLVTTLTIFLTIPIPLIPPFWPLLVLMISSISTIDPPPPPLIRMYHPPPHPHFHNHHPQTNETLPALPIGI